MIPIIPVKKVMTTNPLSISYNETVKSAASTMKQHKVNSLLVKKEEEYVGIITDVDIVKKVMTKKTAAPSRISVESVMSYPISAIDENESTVKANETMSWYHIRHLLVTANGKPVGIISARDLLNPVYEEEGGIPFWPDHALKEIIVVFIMIGIISTLVIFNPAPMEPKADPLITPEHIKPEWFFLASYQILKVSEVLTFMGQWAPKVIGVVGQMIFLLLLIVLPFFDKNPERHPKKRPIATTIGILGVIGFIFFTILGYIS
ncbi:MAG: CBS domain-containing protein [Nitrospirota bacterium]